jgi:hypothetical protein
MDTRGEQSRLLYIPDFQAWERIYQSKVPRRPLSEGKRSNVHVRNPSDVKLRFVSPVEETVDQAESEISSKSKADFRAKKRKIQDTESLPKQLSVKDVVRASTSTATTSSTSLQKQKRKKHRQEQGVKKIGVKDSKKFSYRTLNDIFSKSS